MDLHANVVAINLGKCLYYARCERYRLESVAWEALDVMVRHGYTARANDVLDALKDGPEPRAGDYAFATGLRRQDKVIGAIAPGGGR